MTPPSQTRGADLIASALAVHGVSTVFSLSGNQIMPVYDALFETDLRIIHTRHEGAAVYMAEAAAQATGQVGVALLTAGPGFANGLSAIYSARESETPIVVLSGDSPTARDARGAFQELDQCAAAAPLAKATFRCTHAAGLGEDVARAMAIAASGRPGPVHLALPDDVLRRTAVADPAAASVAVPAADRAADGAELDDIYRRITTAARPIIVAGPQFCRARWKPLLCSLSERLNVPVVAFESPRGLRAPRLGAFADVVGQADLVVTLGKPLNFMIGFGDVAVLNGDCRIIQLDAEAGVLARDRRAHPNRQLTQITCHPGAAVQGLLQRAQGSAATARATATATAWHSTVKSAIAYRPAAWDGDVAGSGQIKSLDIAKAIRSFANHHPDASLIIDGGEIGQWCQATGDVETALINGPSGAIGAGTPYAIAAKVVRPDQPALAVMGDGTAGFYLAEFETAVRENIPIVVVIGNDARWNAEHQIQVRDYGSQRAFACQLTPARYDQVMADLGGHGELVTVSTEILPAIARALASAKPACVNIMFDGQAAPDLASG